MSKHSPAIEQEPHAEDPSEEPAFAIHKLPPPTPEEELASYVLYRETGGKPFEPLESLLRARQERAHENGERSKAA